jgi:nitrous oxidase accessory protein NosD
MRATHRFPLATSLAITLFATSAALAQPQGVSDAVARTVNRRMDITRPGSYVLGSNVEVGAGLTGIRVLVDNVTIDFAGLTLKGPGGPGTIGIDVRGASNVTIRNGSLVGLGIGVVLTEATNVVVEDLQIHATDAGGAPPNVEIGVLLVNSRGVKVVRNVVTDVFLGIFVRGGGSGGNRIAENTITGGDNGQLGICYNPAEGAGPAGPEGDLVYDNHISRMNVGAAFSEGSIDNVFTENTMAFFEMAVDEKTAGSNVIEDNQSVQLAP